MQSHRELFCGYYVAGQMSFRVISSVWVCMSLLLWRLWGPEAVAIQSHGGRCRALAVNCRIWVLQRLCWKSVEICEGLTLFFLHPTLAKASCLESRWIKNWKYVFGWLEHGLDCLESRGIFVFQRAWATGEIHPTMQRLRISTSPLACLAVSADCPRYLQV